MSCLVLSCCLGNPARCVRSVHVHDRGALCHACASFVVCLAVTLLVPGTLMLQGINQMVMSRDYAEACAEIKSVDSQESFSGGVLVVVTGSLSYERRRSRNFVQTFFLAPQVRHGITDLLPWSLRAVIQTSQTFFTVATHCPDLLPRTSDTPGPVNHLKDVARGGRMQCHSRRGTVSDTRPLESATSAGLDIVTH